MRRNGTTLLLAGLAFGVGTTSLNAQETQLACVIMSGDHESAAERASPLDSTSFQLGDGQVKVCYGRPSVRGREIFGSDIVPYDEVWRTGANEPTMIHTSVPLNIGDILVEPGTYSIYTVPGESEWEFIVNTAVDQWGHERYYTEEVRAQELGRVTVPAESPDEPVETFTIRTEPADGASVELILEWEDARIRVPVSPAS